MPAAPIAHPRVGDGPRASLLDAALGLDVGAVALGGAMLLLAGTGRGTADPLTSDPALAICALLAAAAALAGGAVAAVAAVREPPVTRAGRLAVWASPLPLPVLALCGAAAGLGVEPGTALAPAWIAVVVVTFTAVVAGIGTWLDGDRCALLAVPLTAAVDVAFLLVHALAGSW